MARGIMDKGQASLALTLGIIGGVLGVFVGFFVMFVGGAGLLITAEGGGAVIGLGAIAIALGIAGGIGGILASNYPQVATFVLAIAGVGGFVVATVFWILPGLLMIGGAVLAWMSRTEHRGTGSRRAPQAG